MSTDLKMDGALIQESATGLGCKGDSERDCSRQQEGQQVVGLRCFGAFQTTALGGCLDGPVLQLSLGYQAEER